MSNYYIRLALLIISRPYQLPIDALSKIFTREMPFAGYEIKDIKDHVEAGKRPEFPVRVCSWLGG